MKVRDILGLTDKDIRDIEKLKPKLPLKGVGVIKLRADQQKISRLAQTPIFNQGVRGAMNFYKKINDNSSIKMTFPNSNNLTRDLDRDLSIQRENSSNILFLSKVAEYKSKLLSEKGKPNNILYEMKDSFEKMKAYFKNGKKISRTEDTNVRKNLLYQDQITDEIIGLTNNILTSFRENINDFEYSRFKINEVAQYDFNEFRFLKEPNFVPTASAISTQLQDYINKVEIIITQIVQGSPPKRRKWRTETVETAPSFTLDNDYSFSDWVYNEEDIMVDDGEVVDVKTSVYLIDLFVKYFLQYLAADLFEVENQILFPPGASTLDAFSEWFYHLYKENGWKWDSVNSSSDNPSLWEDSLDEVLVLLNRIYPNLQIGDLKYSEGNGYDFRPYTSKSIAFGIRLNYKQNWYPLGVQAGETVKTIPLGPKQVEKIVTKTSSSIKKLNSSETQTSIESSSETSNNNKLSNDIVNESGAKFSAQFDTKVSAPIEVVQVEAGSKIGTELSSSSKETKGQLNEQMHKTAQKMKSDVKVSVSNEFNSTTEYDRSTEISNPNDDIAITYIYSKLQQQYELVTYLNAVSNVVFVPEELPSVQEIQKDWIKKYDWIIAKNLLDQSFQTDLFAIISGNDEDNDYSLDLDKEHFKNVSKTAMESQPEYKNFSGSSVDIFQSQNEIYLRQLDKIRAIKERNLDADKSFKRLKEHIELNILHYMRAIWLAEDKDQRALRYNEKLVPTRWVFVPNHSPGQNTGNGSFSGNFVPDYSSSSLKRLSSIIDLSGPIGFTGNCLIFNMKTNPDLMNLNECLRVIKSYYIKYQVSTENENLNGLNIIHISVIYCGFTKPKYIVKYNSNEKEWVIVESNENIKIQLVRYNERTIYFEGVIITFDKYPDKDIEFSVNIVSTNFLKDPEEKYLPLSNELPGLGKEVAFWTEELINDMILNLPGISVQLNDIVFEKLNDSSKVVLYIHYYEYLYKKSNTKRITVDTNNLMLDILVSNNVVLEDFKRVHRVVDVLKAVEERTRVVLENERRRKRIDQDDLGDPDIENLHNINIQQHT